MIVTFNSNDLSPYIKVTGVKRYVLPPFNLFTNEIVGKDGVQFSKKTLGPMEIVVDFIIKEDTLPNLRATVRTLAGKLFSDVPKKLVFSDEPNFYYMAIVSGTTELEEIIATGKGSITFFSPEPASYGIQKTQAITSGTAYTNAGTYEAKGTITLKPTGTVSYLKITLTTTGEFIYLEDSFLSTDTIVIDLDKESVTKNGSLIMGKVYLTSDFFSIPPGSYTITLNNCTATLVYNERWL